MRKRDLAAEARAVDRSHGISCQVFCWPRPAPICGTEIRPRNVSPRLDARLVQFLVVINKTRVFPVAFDKEEFFFHLPFNIGAQLGWHVFRLLRYVAWRSHHRRTLFSRCICRCSRMRARLPPPCVLLPHTYTQDGWFLQPKRRPARIPRRTLFSRCICRCSTMRARLPVHKLLHTQVSR
jgi:hypothetical protein